MRTSGRTWAGRIRTGTAAAFILLAGCGGSEELRPAAPQAGEDRAVVLEDSVIEIDVLANDRPPNGGSLTLVSLDPPAHGRVETEGNLCRYIPDPDFSGPDRFSYTAATAQGGTARGTVLVEVTPVNDPPIARHDVAELEEDQDILIRVLLNDTDADNDPLRVLDFTQGRTGEVRLEGDALRYTAGPDFHGEDSFRYRIGDADGGESEGAVTVSVNNLQDPPLPSADHVIVDEDDAIVIDVLANDIDVDGDPLEIVAYEQGSSGTVTREGDRLRYVPDPDFHGEDRFAYAVADPAGQEVVSQVTVTVTPVNDAPRARDDLAQTREEEPVAIPVLGNDEDVDGDPLQIVAFSQGTGGEVSLSGDRLLYTPGAAFHGTDSFSYTISDPEGLQSAAGVGISVDQVNDPPVANPDHASVEEDSSVLVPVLANDTDIDGDPLILAGYAPPRNGTVLREGDALRYTPAPDFNGVDGFTYEIEDGQGGSAEGSVSITVRPVNDDLIGTPDKIEVREDEPSGWVDVLANDRNLDGPGMALIDVTQGSFGRVERQENLLRYTPAPDYFGPDAFTYDVEGEPGEILTVDVTVTVLPVNDPPAPQDDVVETVSLEPVRISVLANDFDADGDPLSIVDFGPGAAGTVTQEGDVLVYWFESDFAGEDSFIYQVTDGTESASARVSVILHASPPPPGPSMRR